MARECLVVLTGQRPAGTCLEPLVTFTEFVCKSRAWHDLLTGKLSENFHIWVFCKWPWKVKWYSLGKGPPVPALPSVHLLYLFKFCAEGQKHIRKGSTTMWYKRTFLQKISFDIKNLFVNLWRKSHWKINYVMHKTSIFLWIIYKITSFCTIFFSLGAKDLFWQKRHKRFSKQFWILFREKMKNVQKWQLS